MKKYKLKKWYPSLPTEWRDEDITVVEKSLGYFLDFNLKGKTRDLWSPLSSTEVENNRDYWDEVVEKDYEVLNKHSVGSLIYPGHPQWDKKSWSIYSVKRLSDGEVFTIGDCIFNGYCNTKILEFNILNKELKVLTNSGTTILNNLSHIKKPLFTTEDGVDIFDVSEKYYLVDDWSILPQTYNLKRGYKHFSTKEAAKNYILMNKPCLSIKDLEELDVNIDSFDRVEIIKLVKSKL